MHDGREHVLFPVVFDHDLGGAARRGGEGQGGGDEDVDTLEALDEFLAEHTPVALRLQVVRGQVHLAELEQRADVVAIVVRPRAEPFLVVGAWLARLDRELGGDIALNGRHGDLFDVDAKRLERLQRRPDRVAHRPLHVRQRVVANQADP